MTEIRCYDRLTSFHLRAKNKHDPDDFETLFLCFVVILLGDAQLPIPITNWSKFARFLFL